MYDDLFDFDSFDDISDYGGATESMFDYGADDYALEGEKFDKVKDFVKKALAGLAQAIATAISGIRRFLFGEKSQLDDDKILKFSAAGYFKALWKACYKDAVNKLNAASSAPTGSAPFLGESDIFAASEAVSEKKLDKIEKKYENSMVKTGESIVSFSNAISKIVDLATANGDTEVAKLFNTGIKSSMLQQLSSGHDTPLRKDANKIINDLKTIGSAANRTAQATGAKINNPGLLSGFKAFCGSIARFFKYAHNIVILAVKSSTLVKRVRKEVNQGSKLEKLDAARRNNARNRGLDRQSKMNGYNEAKTNLAAGFLGRIANESYIDGYYSALEDMGIDMDYDSEEDIYDDYAGESAVAAVFEW